MREDQTQEWQRWNCIACMMQSVGLDSLNYHSGLNVYVSSTTCAKGKLIFPSCSFLDSCNALDLDIVWQWVPQTNCSSCQKVFPCASFKFRCHWMFWCYNKGWTGISQRMPVSMKCPSWFCIQEVLNKQPKLKTEPSEGHVLAPKHHMEYICAPSSFCMQERWATGRDSCWRGLSVVLWRKLWTRVILDEEPRGLAWKSNKMFQRAQSVLPWLESERCSNTAGAVVTPLRYLAFLLRCSGHLC